MTTLWEGRATWQAEASSQAVDPAQVTRLHRAVGEALPVAREQAPGDLHGTIGEAAPRPELLVAVGAGAVLTENKNFSDRSVIFGAPAKAVREVTEDNLMRMRVSAADYVRRGIQYKKELKRIG